MAFWDFMTLARMVHLDFERWDLGFAESSATFCISLLVHSCDEQKPYIVVLSHDLLSVFGLQTAPT